MPGALYFLAAATMTEEVKQLISLSLKHPVRLAADPTAAAPQELTQEIVRLKGAQVRPHRALCMLCCAVLRWEQCCTGVCQRRGAVPDAAWHVEACVRLVMKREMELVCLSSRQKVT